MTFWKKYNKYFRMGLLVLIYGIVMFTSILPYLFQPLRAKLGTSIYGSQSYIIIGNVLVYMVLFIFSILLVPDLYYVDFKIFNKTKIGKKFALIGIGYGALVVATVIGNVFSMSMSGQLDSVNESTINTILHADLAWLYIPIVCIFGPIVEEVVFRGIIQGVIIGNKFRNLGNARVFLGILISSLAFGVIHVFDAGDYVQIFPYFFMGLALGSLAYASKSIYPSIIVHIINNTISVVASMALLFIFR